jgi:drug/metabolite transporter (DMT)-like permease
VLASAAGYGSWPVLARVAYTSGATVATVLLFRFLIAVVLLWAVLLFRGRGGLAAGLVRSPQRLAGILGLGVIFAVIATTYLNALTFVHVSVVAVLFYLYPAIVVLLAASVLKERLERRQMVALGMALTGSIVMVGLPQSLGQPGVAASGILLGLGLSLVSALAYAIYIVASKRLAAGIPADVMAVFSLTGTTAVLLVGATAGRGVRLTSSGEAWLSIFAIAVLATVVATTFFFAGVARLGPSRAAILSTVEPVVTVMLAVLVLSERPGWLQILGGLLILTAALVLTRQAASLSAERAVAAVKD